MSFIVEKFGPALHITVALRQCAVQRRACVVAPKLGVVLSIWVTAVYACTFALTKKR